MWSCGGRGGRGGGGRAGRAMHMLTSVLVLWFALLLRVVKVLRLALHMPR